MSNVTKVVNQIRLQGWLEEVRACRARPEGQSVNHWCAENGINPKTYYYHQRCVRQSCLDMVEERAQTFVRLSPPTLPETTATIPEVNDREIIVTGAPAAVMKVGNLEVSISANAPAEFLKNIVGALAYAE